MIKAIANIATSPVLSTLSQSTTASVTLETTMKALGRPGFILIDNNIDSDTRQYAAMKEFVYQATCLLIYGVLVVPMFKKGGFKFAKNVIFKNRPEFQKFKCANEFLDYHKIASKNIKNRKASMMKNHHEDKFTPKLRAELLNKDKPEKYPLIKGAIELGNLVGSVIGLAIIAPQISHYTVHPIMKALGFEKAKQKEKIENALTVKLQVPAEPAEKKA